MLPVKNLVEVDEGAYLHSYCAYAWIAFAQHVRAKHGIRLVVSDGYRPINRQERFFLTRYTRSLWDAAKKADGRTPVDAKWYRGERWYLLPGYDLAAVPGTSNHGWGFAADAAIMEFGLIRKFTNDQLVILTEEAPKFGWLWEVTSEPWHLVYTLDHSWIPQPAPPTPTPTPPQEEEETMKAFQLVDTDGQVYLFVPGMQSVSLGGLPHVHAILHNQGQAELINAGDPMPPDQLGQFSARWDASN